MMRCSIVAGSASSAALIAVRSAARNGNASPDLVPRRRRTISTYPATTSSSVAAVEPPRFATDEELRAGDLRCHAQRDVGGEVFAVAIGETRADLGRDRLRALLVRRGARRR